MWAYVLPVMFFRHEISEVRDFSSDRRETLLHDRKLAEFYNASPPIRGETLLQKFGGQNMQNFGRFYTIIQPQI